MKKNKTIFWATTIIIALMEGAMPLVTWIAAPQYITVGTKALGYPDYFAYAIVVAKIFGVIAIVYPKTPKMLREWAYAGFTFNLLFAFISHAVVDREIGNLIMPLVVLAILIVSYTYGKKINRIT
ncbi:DoxX family protein [Flavobacterium sp. TBRC 19031]|uniref:DoxX family protein n=1 Tax=Flavobacterium mekongense TaxID=3379707 RepID=UPI00399A0E81